MLCIIYFMSVVGVVPFSTKSMENSTPKTFGASPNSPRFQPSLHQIPTPGIENTRPPRYVCSIGFLSTLLTIVYFNHRSLSYSIFGLSGASLCSWYPLELRCRLFYFYRKRRTVRARGVIHKYCRCDTFTGFAVPANNVFSFASTQFLTVSIVNYYLPFQSQRTVTAVFFPYTPRHTPCSLLDVGGLVASMVSGTSLMCNGVRRSQ